MQLNKFGAVLAFAIELERQTADFYDSAAAGHADERFSDSVFAARKRLRRLENMRRELVNEMLLEPIADFEQPALPELAAGDQMPLAQFENRRCQLDDMARCFYQNAAEKLATVAPAVSQALSRMATERSCPAGP